MATHYKDYWVQSLVNASAAEVLAEHDEGALGCEYFLGGLLVDIGRLAMLKTIGSEYLPVIETADQVTIEAPD